MLVLHLHHPSLHFRVVVHTQLSGGPDATVLTLQKECKHLTPVRVVARGLRETERTN